MTQLNVTPQGFRTAAYLETKARIDAAKTKGVKKCKPPNRKCGGRCIPPDWDCRLRGEGGDSHLRAAGKSRDPLAALAHVQRGALRIAKGLTRGNFSEIEGGRRAIIRGVVKGSKGDLQEKKELQKKLIAGTVAVGAVLGVVGLGVGAHRTLSASSVYRRTIGRRIDESFARAENTILNNIPFGVGKERQARQRAAVGVVTSLGRRVPAVGAQGDLSSEVARLSTPRYVGSSAIATAVAKVRPASYADFDSFRADSVRAYYGARTNDGNIHAQLAAQETLLKQYKIQADFGNSMNLEARKRTVLEGITTSLTLEKERLLANAKARGIGLNSEQAKKVYINSLLSNSGLTRTQEDFARSYTTQLLSRTPGSVADKLYKESIDQYDTFFTSVSTALEQQYTPGGKARAGALPLEYDDIIRTARIKHAEYLDRTMGRRKPVGQPTESPAWESNKRVWGPNTADLTALMYFETNAGNDTRAEFTVGKGFASAAWQEVKNNAPDRLASTRTTAQPSTLDKYGQLKRIFGALIPPDDPTFRSGASQRGGVMRRVSRAQRIASMMRQKVNGKPRYATREAAEAELDRQQKRKDASARFDFTPKSERKGKPCGKSFIPRSQKCSKRTSVKYAQPKASQSSSDPLDKAAKVAAVAGGLASVAGAISKRKTIARVARKGTLKARKTLRSRNRELYRRTAVRARAERRVASNVARTQTRQTATELSKRTIKTLSKAEVDTGISRLPKRFQDPVRRLVGDAKLSAAHLALKAKGGRITSVNNIDNFSNWEMRDGTLLSTGSVNESLIVYNTKPQDSIGGVQTYSTQFRVDGEFDAKSPAASRNVRKVASTVKKMFKSHMEQIPDRSIITAIPYSNDNKGKKRRSIYEKYGFRQALSYDERLFAMKKEGKFTQMNDNHIEQIADLIRDDARSDSKNVGISFVAQPRFDFTPKSERKGKPCGKSFIPRSQKCTKSASAKYAERATNVTAAVASSKTVRNVAIAGAASGVAALALIGANKRKMDAYRRRVPKSALEAEKLAIEFEREMREKAARRLKKRPQDVSGYEASVYNYNDKGFERGFSPFETDPKWYGQTKQSKGGVVVLSYSDEYGKGGYNMVDGGAFKEIWGDRDPLPFHNAVSQPVRGAGPDNLQQAEQREFLSKVEKLGGTRAKAVAKNVIGVKESVSSFKYLRDNVNERGFNPDSVRLAAFLVAQRRLTGKSVDILAYSNGGNVASEALAILSEMGYKDVKVLNVAGPTFGMFKHSPENMQTFVSKGDEFYKTFGDKAFTGGNTKYLKNDKIPHGLMDALDLNNPNAGDVAQNRRARRSYMLDDEVRREGYKFFTVDKVRSRQFEEEILWRVSTNKRFEGDLQTLFGAQSDATNARYKKLLANKDQRAQVKRQIRTEVEDRMLEQYYEGYNPKKVKRAQNAIRKELETYISTPKQAVTTRRPMSLNQRVSRLMEQNPGMSREAALRRARREQSGSTKRGDAVAPELMRAATYLAVQADLRHCAQLKAQKPLLRA